MAVVALAAKNRPGLARLRGASAGPFPVITLVLLIVIGLGSFFAATYLEVFNDGSGEPWTTDANAFSRSAIGHRAFVTALRKLGVPVEISRFRTLDKVGPGNLLLVLEPDLSAAGRALLKGIGSAPHALLVLPKWQGHTSLKKPIWIDRMRLLDTGAAQDVAQTVVPDAAVERVGSTVAIRSERFGGRMTIDNPQYLAGGNAYIDALVLEKDGILLGVTREAGNETWILSDPDLISNFGIDEAENGVVAINIVKALLPKGGTVIVDETAHGFEQRPNLLRALLAPPFMPVGVAGIAALLVLVWAGVARFGAPQRETEALAAGKLTLVRNTAQLLRLGTSAASLLQGYRKLMLADALGELHGPAGLDERQQAAWLDRAAAHRGLAARVTPILDRMTQGDATRFNSGRVETPRLDTGRALRLALDLHRWKQEILHGTVTARPVGPGSQSGTGKSGIR